MKSLSPPTKNLHQLIIPGTIAIASLAGLILSSYFAVQSVTSQTPSNHPQLAELHDAEPHDAQSNEQPANTSTLPDNTQPDSPTTFPNHNRPDDMDNFRSQSSPNLSTGYAILISLFASLFCFSICFIIYRLRRKNFYQNHDKLTIYILASILASVISSTTLVFIINAALPANTFHPEASATKDEVDLDLESTTSSHDINLSDHDTDLTITESGTYTISGKFSHSLIINAPNQSVELILDNVKIASIDTAAIIGLSAKQIAITTAKGSINNLSDGGNSSYDGCIFSNAELIFDGEGILNIKGQQNEGEGIATENNNITINGSIIAIESVDDGLNAGGDDGGTITINDGTLYINADGDGIDSNKNTVINGGTIFTIGSDTGGDAGIDTDEGYAINGGTIVALGSDMLEKPLSSSKQQSLTYSLSSKIAQDTIVSIIKDNETILSFSAPKSFRTIVVSKTGINAEDAYSIYTNGSHTGALTYGIYSGGDYTKGEKLL